MYLAEIAPQGRASQWSHVTFGLLLSLSGATVGGARSLLRWLRPPQTGRFVRVLTLFHQTCAHLQVAFEVGFIATVARCTSADQHIAS